MQYVSPRRVGTVQEPGIGNAVRSERMASFHFADIGQRLRLLRTSGVAARISPRRVDHGHTLVLLLNQLGDVGGDFDVVVGMTDNLQNVHFVTAIRLRIGRSLRSLRMGNYRYH